MCEFVGVRRALRYSAFLFFINDVNSFAQPVECVIVTAEDFQERVDGGVTGTR